MSGCPHCGGVGKVGDTGELLAEATRSVDPDFRCQLIELAFVAIWVRCTECGAAGPPRNNVEDAIAGWERRTP